MLQCRTTSVVPSCPVRERSSHLDESRGDLLSLEISNLRGAISKLRGMRPPTITPQRLSDNMCMIFGPKKTIQFLRRCQTMPGSGVGTVYSVHGSLFRAKNRAHVVSVFEVSDSGGLAPTLSVSCSGDIAATCI